MRGGASCGEFFGGLLCPPNEVYIHRQRPAIADTSKQCPKAMLLFICGRRGWTNVKELDAKEDPTCFTLAFRASILDIPRPLDPLRSIKKKTPLNGIYYIILNHYVVMQTFAARRPLSPPQPRRTPTAVPLGAWRLGPRRIWPLE